MDNNEKIVHVWLETKGFLVRNRIKYRVNKETNSGWNDIDLVAYRPSDNKKIVVDVTGWMKNKIRYSDVSSNRGLLERLQKITSVRSRTEIKKVLEVKSKKEYEIWSVVAFISDNQRGQVQKEMKKYVDHIFEFPTIMNDLVCYVKKNSNANPESEILHTIRALLLCGLIK